MIRRKRIGIFGGTFNPPHIAHVAAAEAFSRCIDPDILMIIPDFIPPHKSFAGTVTPAQRLDMCKLAFSHIKNAVISDLEISRVERAIRQIPLLSFRVTIGICISSVALICF